MQWTSLLLHMDVISCALSTPMNIHQNYHSPYCMCMQNMYPPLDGNKAGLPHLDVDSLEKKRFSLRQFLKFLEFFTHIFPKVSWYSALYFWGYFQKTLHCFILIMRKNKIQVSVEIMLVPPHYQSTCVVQRYINYIFIMSHLYWVIQLFTLFCALICYNHFLIVFLRKLFLIIEISLWKRIFT